MVNPNDAIDGDFARFCRTGDPDALGAVFDATADRLLRVALWLCGNRADAEDAVQRTFLQAIEARGCFEPGRPALPWLLGVLGNQVRKQRRERARRGPTPLPRENVDPAVVAATTELESAVAQVQSQLGDPYREVLILHLQHGFAAHEIAARLRRPAGTVRTQLMRALSTLRERLPRGFLAGMAPAWLTDGANSLLAGTRATVTAAARHHVLADRTRSSTLRRPIAWASMLTVASGLTAWWATTSSTSPAIAPRSRTALVGDVRHDVSPAVANAPAHDSTMQRHLVATAATARVVVRLRWADDDAPASGQVATCRTGWHPLRERHAVTDRAGVYVFEQVEAGTITAMCEGRGRESFALGDAESRTVTLRCARGIRVFGTVLDQGGRPVAAAAIVAGRPGMSRPPITVATAEASGHFDVQVPCGTDVHAVAAGHAPSLSWAIEGQPGEAYERNLRLRGVGGAVSIAVNDRHGDRVPFARIALGSRWSGQSLESRADLDSSEPPGPSATADAEGIARFDGLAVGSHPVHAWAIGCAPWSGAVTIAAATPASLQVVLDPGSTMSGTVRTATGDPVSGASVEVSFGANLPWTIEDASDEAGHYSIDSLPACDAVVVAQRYPFGTARDQVVVDGGVTTWDQVLDPGRCVRGRVVDANGRPIARATVGWQHRGKQRESWQQTDADGKFLLTALPDKPVDVCVYGSLWTPVAVRLDVHAPCDDLLLAVEDTPSADGTLRGRVIDAHDQPLRCDVAVNGCYVRAATDGTFRQDGLPSGRYELMIRLDGNRFLPWQVVTLPPHQDLDVGTFALRPSTLVVRASNPDGTPVARGAVSLSTLDGLAAPGSPIVNGIARFAYLQPGRYRIGCGSDRLEAQGMVDVVEGGTEIALRLLPRVLCKVRCTSPYAMGRDARATVTVARGADQPERRIEAPISDDDHAGENLLLPTGRHVLHATFGTTLVGDLELDVAEPWSDEPVMFVTIPLLPGSK